jgi:2-dehydro-3-deoxygalactonokinase
MGAALIGIDWGTSNFRAFLLDEGGAILDRRSGPHGILAVKDRDFGAVLDAEVAEWLQQSRVPVLMSGMIGSRQGWLETPYVTAPAGVADLAAALVSVPYGKADVRIVGGVETVTRTMRDVMRGEEMQVLGALPAKGVSGGRFLLPGTHSKWVSVEKSRIVGFSTYMTGEIYAAARDHTILGKLMQDGGHNSAIFLRGARDGAAPGQPGSLLNRLFGVRTAGLFGEISAPDLPDYLSGLLIGAELADAGSKETGAVAIIASDTLARRYELAAAELGIGAEIVSPDCAAMGYLAIARMVDLIPRVTGRESR